MKARNTNIELLRIISIFAIMFLHMYRHPSGGEVFGYGFSLNKVFLILFGSWGLVGVFILAIVSSYFLIDSQELKINRLLNMVFCTSLYALLCFLFSCIFLGKPFLNKEIIKAILSPVLNSYWYITSYIVLYLLHPILNNIIQSLSTCELKKVVIAGFSLCFVYKYIYVSAPIDTIGLFLAIYFGMALFNRVKGRINYNKVYLGGWISFVAVVCLGLLHALFYDRSSVIKYIYSQSISKFSPFMVMIAFALFCAYINKKPSYSKTINFLSKSVLPVYLIHENDYVYPILWDSIFEIQAIYSKSYFALLFVNIAVLVFAICTVIDIFLRPVYNLVSDKFCNYIGIIEGKLNEKI